MLPLKQYLLGIIAAAIFVCVIIKLTPVASKQRSMIQMIGGIVIVLTIIAPLTKLRIDDYISFYNNISLEAQSQVDIGTDSAKKAIRQVIKEQTETYILEKAAALGAELQAEITLDSGEEPHPVSVKISGNVSPYAKNQLCAMIVRDIGIPKEMQKWT